MSEIAAERLQSGSKIKQEQKDYRGGLPGAPNIQKGNKLSQLNRVQNNRSSGQVPRPTQKHNDQYANPNNVVNSNKTQDYFQQQVVVTTKPSAASGLQRYSQRHGAGPAQAKPATTNNVHQYKQKVETLAISSRPETSYQALPSERLSSKPAGRGDANTREGRLRPPTTSTTCGNFWTTLNSSLKSGGTALSRKISPVFQEGTAGAKKQLRKPGSIDPARQKHGSKNSRVTPREGADYLNYKQLQNAPEPKRIAQLAAMKSGGMSKERISSIEKASVEAHTRMSSIEQARLRNANGNVVSIVPQHQRPVVPKNRVPPRVRNFMPAEQLKAMVEDDDAQVRRNSGVLLDTFISTYKDGMTLANKNNKNKEVTGVFLNSRAQKPLKGNNFAAEKEKGTLKAAKSVSIERKNNQMQVVQVVQKGNFVPAEKQEELHRPRIGVPLLAGAVQRTSVVKNEPSIATGSTQSSVQTQQQPSRKKTFDPLQPSNLPRSKGLIGNVATIKEARSVDRDHHDTPLLCLPDNSASTLLKAASTTTRQFKVSQVSSHTKHSQSTTFSLPSDPIQTTDFSLLLTSAIHKNLLVEDKHARGSPLNGHTITRDYRTKMVDWMVEVCTSFKCCQRSYFLAVTLFDEYLRRSLSVNKRQLTNDNVHGTGVACMYLASKYEDIYPLHSRVVAEKIAHNAFKRSEILEREEEFMRLFQFEFSHVTQFDVYQTYFAIAEKKFPALASEAENYKKIKDLSMLYVLMSVQNVDFAAYSHHRLVFACIHAACTILMIDRRYGGKSNRSPSPGSGAPQNYFKKFRARFWIAVSQLEQIDGESPVEFSSKPSINGVGRTGVRNLHAYHSPQPINDTPGLVRNASQEKHKTPTPSGLPLSQGPTPQSNKAQVVRRSLKHTTQVAVLASKLIEFHEQFDKWHCGLNQLKRFKSLDFPVLTSKQVDQGTLQNALKIGNSTHTSSASPECGVWPAARQNEV